MQRWEYLRVIGYIEFGRGLQVVSLNGETDDSWEAGEPPDLLLALGNEGWELVSAKEEFDSIAKFYSGPQKLDRAVS